MVKFGDIKDKLKKIISEKSKTDLFPGEDKGFALVDGFFNLPLQSELSGNIVVGGPSVPMVAIVGNASGRMYFFALKALIPDSELNMGSNDRPCPKEFGGKCQLIAKRIGNLLKRPYVAVGKK